MKLTHGFSLCIAFFLSSSSVLYAQQCDENIEPDQGAFRYQKRVGDERCEGTYKKYRAANSLRLISFTAGSISYTTNSNAKLEISSPTTGFGKDVNVQGNNFNMNALNSLISYRLDMILTEKSNKKIIPLKDVINKIPIPPDHLGFLGFVVNNNVQVFVPLIVVEQDLNNHYPSTWAGQNYVILLNTEINIDKLSFSIISLGSPPVTIKPFTLMGEDISPDSKLQINVNNKDIPEGKHDFLLQIKYETSGKSEITKYLLFIP